MREPPPEGKPSGLNKNVGYASIVKKDLGVIYVEKESIGRIALEKYRGWAAGILLLACI